MPTRRRPVLLLDAAKPLRQPLDAWATALRANLLRAADRLPEAAEETAGAPRKAPEETAAALNLGALVTVFAGHLDRAVELCARQMAWTSGVAADTGRPELLFMALQPWTNLGRLERIAGRPAESLPYFGLLEAYDEERRVSIGGCTFTASDWRSVKRTRGTKTRAYLRQIYVLDRWKSLTAAGDDEGALVVAGAAGNGDDPLAVVAREAAIVSLIRLGRLAEALDTATAGAETADAYERIVFHLHQLTVLNSSAHREAARELALILCQVVRLSGLDRIATEPALRLVQALAGEVEEAGLTAEACGLYRDGVSAARAANDEPFQYQFLQGVRRTAPPDEREPYESAVLRMRSVSGYREVAGVAARTASPHDEAVGRLDSAMRDVLSRRARTGTSRPRRST